MAGKRVWDIFASFDERERARVMFERLVSERRPRRYEGSWTATDGVAREIAWSNSALMFPSS